MSGSLAGLLGALTVSALGCLAISLAVPVPPAPFGRHLARRVVRILARAVVVLGVLAVGVGPLEGEPAALTAGALGGWAVAAGREAWQMARHGERSAR
jgi:hypothetical protein